jgi:flagellar biosynthesis protein FlhG
LVTVNLAVALARLGRRVLLLDCSAGPRSAAWLLGAPPVRDLLEGTRGVSDPESLVAAGFAGVRVARAKALVTLAGAPGPEVSGLARVLDTLREDAEVVLVDAPPGSVALGAASGELILLAGPGSQAMIESYRLIKRLYTDFGQRRIYILVNRASPTHADRIFGNLSATSRRFLNLPLEAVGRIPDDERMLRAARLRQPVVEAFPEAGCARALCDCANTLSRRPYPGEDGFADFATRLVETAQILGSTGH